MNNPKLESLSKMAEGSRRSSEDQDSGYPFPLQDHSSGYDGHLFLTAMTCNSH